MQTVWLLIGSGSTILLLVGVLYWAAKNSGRSEVLAEAAKKEADNAKKATTVLVEHRTTNDAVDRLSNNKF